MINVKLDPEKIKTDSVIFKGSALSTYQSAMNQASQKLCFNDPTLINNRGRLIEQARQLVHDEGFQYKKKNSRSKAFGKVSNPDSGSEPKKPKWSQEMRSKRIAEIEEDLQGLDSQMRFLERSREKYSATQQYEHAAEKCKEIASIRERKRKLLAETTQLQKLDVKSKKYQKKKKTCKDQTQEPDLKQTKLFHGVVKQSTGDQNSNDGVTEKSNVKDNSKDCTENVLQDEGENSSNETMEDDTLDGKGSNKQQVEVEGTVDEMQKDDTSGHFLCQGLRGQTKIKN